MTKIFPEEPKFVVGQVGFEGFDILGRKALGQRLTELVDRIDQPMVIALDGGWGTGKSFFLRLWVGAHKIELNGKASIIYFDAFEHDYLDDPLINLVSAMIKKADDAPWAKSALKMIKVSAVKLAKPALRIGLAAATAGATELASAVWADAVIDATKNEASGAVEDFWKKESGRINAMQQFRKAIEELTKPSEAGQPPQKIVFIIDELDRCRPDYALSLLEIVKHFFSVENVHFILGANIKALEGSILARYGSEIDADAYLRKFIQLTVKLPKEHEGSDVKMYLSKNAQSFGLGTVVFSDLSALIAFPVFRDRVTIRDIQKIMTRISVCPKEFSSFAGPLRVFVLGLMLIEVSHKRLYTSIRSKSIVFTDVRSWLNIAQRDSMDRSHAALLCGTLNIFLGGESGNLETDLFGGYNRISEIMAMLDKTVVDCLDIINVPYSTNQRDQRV